MFPRRPRGEPLKSVRLPGGVMLTPVVAGRCLGSGSQAAGIGIDPVGQFCHGSFGGQAEFQAGLEIKCRPAVDIRHNLQVAPVGASFLLQQQAQARIARVALEVVRLAVVHHRVGVDERQVLVVGAFEQLGREAHFERGRP